jgi:hypothetical protein
MPAKPCRNYRGHSKKVSLIMEGEQRDVTKFFVEEGIKEVKIIDRLNKHYDRDAIQRTHVYYWIKGGPQGQKIL